MDEMNPFEQQLTSGLGRMAGPGRNIDAVAMARIVSAQSPKWRFGSMFSATKFVVAGVIVALFGGFLLSGVLTMQLSEEVAPAAVSSTPSRDLLSRLATEEVEPGVFRVLRDGVRDLEWDVAGMELPDQPEIVTTDGDTWVVLGDTALRLGDLVDYSVDATVGPPREISVTGPSSVDLVPADYVDPASWSSRSLVGTEHHYGGDYAVGPNETVWDRLGDERTLRRHTPAGTEEFTADDGVPIFTGIAPVVGLRTVVAPDGAAWFSLYDSFDRNPVASSDCGGLVRYDGQVSTYFLQDRGFCVAGLDVDGQGRAWVLGWSHILQDLEDSRWNDGLTQIYLITPESVTATE